MHCVIMIPVATPYKTIFSKNLNYFIWKIIFINNIITFIFIRIILFPILRIFCIKIYCNSEAMGT